MTDTPQRIADVAFMYRIANRAEADRVIALVHQGDIAGACAGLRGLIGSELPELRPAGLKWLARTERELELEVQVAPTAAA